jgi:hypothetical protein
MGQLEQKVFNVRKHKKLRNTRHGPLIKTMMEGNDKINPALLLFT